MKKVMMNIIVFTFVLTAFHVFAAWHGPVQVLSRDWGSGDSQLGFESQDNFDAFPKDFGVSVTGNIVIADWLNEVLHIFDKNGLFIRDIKSPLKWNGWPASVLVSAECAVVGYVQMTHTFDIISGDLIGKANNMGGADYVDKDCSRIFSGGKDIWKAYSPTGQLIKTYTSRPPELGVVEKKYISPGKYRITVTYSDKVWTTIDEIAVPYQRDTHGNIYVVGDVDITRYSNCGKEMASLFMPRKQYRQAQEGDTEETSLFIGMDPPGAEFAEYGSPVLAPNGDVYTWKVTADKYSIIKWTWVDEPGGDYGPDAPTGLTVTPSTTGLYLAWKPAPQDPGCVTGYELSRSTSAGGVYSVLTTVDKGVGNYNDTTALEGTTYFYKIRAKSGNDFSPYTAEVSGKR